MWAGAFITNATTHVPLLAACGIATGNTLEAMVGVWLLRRFADVDRSLDGLRHVTVLIMGAAVVSTWVSATVGVTTLCLAGLQQWTRFGLLWWIWWLGDATGDLLAAPVLLTAPLWWRANEYRRRVGEAAVLEATAIALSTVVFANRLDPLAGHPLEFTVFPLVIWAAWRFNHAGAALISASVSCIAVWGTLHGTGPFSGTSVSSPQESIILLQIFMAVMSTTGLVFGAAIADRNRSERLREADHAVTAILSEEHDLQGAAPRILKAVCETLDWDVGILWQANDEQQVLEYVDSWGRDRRTDEFVADSRTRRFQPGIGLPGRVWSSAQPVWIGDVVVDANFPRSPVAARLGLHGGFAFPILVGRHVLGVMEFFARETRRVDTSLLALMAAAGSQIGQFIDRRRAQRRAAESDALSSAVVDAALDCVITIDANGRILEFNPAATQTFGLSREQALGRELAEVLVPPRLRDRHRDALRRCVETGEGRILGQRVEMPALRADGTEFTVELAVTRVGIAQRPAFTAHVRDITDRKRIEEERAGLLARERAARIQAEEASRTKDQFLATISHELRTPLTAILGWASMLRTRQFDPERIQQIHESVYRNAQAQAQIVDDLLDVSRVVVGQLRLELQPMDVGEVARLGLETIRPTAAVKGVTIESDIPASTCIVLGDPARLQQVIWNLLSNAVKFTSSGGTITLAVRQSGSQVTIEVRDTGIGIPAASLPHVFERFWQRDGTTTRTHGGLGLGLALVRHLVELHGGGVRAASGGEGRGSTFTVALPGQGGDVAARSLSWRPAHADEQPHRPSLQGVTVLVVDDDAAARELFAAILGGLGARVMCAESAANAMDIFERHPVQMLIIDIGMPDEDGFMLLKRIRDRERASGLSQTPAVAVTAYAGTLARDRTLEAGFAAHVPKPVLPQDLVSALLTVLGRPG